MRCRSKMALPLSVVAVVLTTLSLSWWERQEGGALRKATDQNVELSRQTAAAARRGEAKTLVVRRLLAGGLTLFEAAAWFRHIDEATSDCPTENWRIFNGDSAEEKICRQVIRWVDSLGWYGADLEKPARLADSLKRELADQIARHGTVILPNLPEEASEE